MSQRISRYFMGWDEPILPAAAAWLLEHALDICGKKCDELEQGDLSGIIVVVPGSRARRVLTGFLVERAEARGEMLVPPTVVTPGELPAAVLGLPGTPAAPLVRRLAWVSALQSVNHTSLAPFVLGSNETFSASSLFRIASALERSSDELAGAGLRFADVPMRAGTILPDSETERWNALATIQDAAEKRLFNARLIDDALGTMAYVLNAHADGVARSAHVVLIGIAELHQIERLSLERCASTVDALVFGPEELAERFDSLGLVQVDEWSAAEIDLDDTQVIFAEDQDDQAQRALIEIARCGSSQAVQAERVVLGMANPDDLAKVRRVAALTSAVELRGAQGTPLTHTPPGVLLQLIRAHVRDFSMDTLIELVRHPDMERALLSVAREDSQTPSRRIEWWLRQLDSVRREHVLTEPDSLPASVSENAAKAIRFVQHTLHAQLGTLIEDRSTPQQLHIWADAVRSVFESLYSDRQLNPQSETGRLTIAGLDALRRALDELALTAVIADSLEPVVSWEALAAIEDRLSREFAPEPPSRSAIEALGWLELAMDPAPNCVVMGMVEGCVPASSGQDGLLPDSLRTVLGLATHESRFARDAYLISLIAASRNAFFLCARRGDDGDPLLPSRLLLRGPRQTLAHRVKHFVDPPASASPHVTLTSKVQAGERDQFEPRLVIGDEYEPPKSMRVTDFGVYMRSPARWYLERSLGLTEHDEPPRELTAALYGSLAHSTLERFGRDPDARELDCPKQVCDALSAFLDDAARARFGAHLPIAVRIQNELLRMRLKYFAHEQAQRRRDGWRLLHVEWSPADSSKLPVLDAGKVKMPLRGKIDRIDVHDDGRWAIIDYKTGSVARKGAKQAHQRKDGRWINLQLPLYLHLMRELQPPETIELGYAGMPAKDGDPVWSFAQWTADELRSADAAANEIVRNICEYKPGDFVEPGSKPPKEGTLGFITGERFDRTVQQAQPEPKPIRQPRDGS